MLYYLLLTQLTAYLFLLFVYVVSNSLYRIKIWLNRHEIQHILFITNSIQGNILADKHQPINTNNYWTEWPSWDTTIALLIFNKCSEKSDLCFIFLLSNWHSWTIIVLYTYLVTRCPPVVGPMYESRTGKNIRPWAAPMRTIPRYIL